MNYDSFFDALFAIRLVIAFSFICVLSSIYFSSYLIRKHLQFFNQPNIQSKILGIIYMVPIYSVDSFLGLLWPNSATYINLFRDCYEVSFFLSFQFFGCHRVWISLYQLLKTDTSPFRRLTYCIYFYL
jgi:hypothetical protein